MSFECNTRWAKCTPIHRPCLSNDLKRFGNFDCFYFYFALDDSDICFDIKAWPPYSFGMLPLSMGYKAILRKELDFFNGFILNSQNYTSFDQQL